MKKYKVIFADLDGTIIDTISGETFPKGIWDMKIKFDVLDKIKEVKPECLLIVTNQGGIEKGFVSRRSFNIKMEYLCRSIKEYTGIEVEYSYCEKNDPNNVYRKPNIGMIDSLMTNMIHRGIVKNGISTNDILMIGDASGKEGQFSDSDKKCAENAGFDYLDVNDFVSMESSDWISVKDKLPDLKVINNSEKNSDEVLLCLLGKEVVVGKLVVSNPYKYWKSTIDGCCYPFNNYVTHWQPFVLPKKEQIW